MIYRVGSFNCLNFGSGSNKDLQVFINIIQQENLDVIALQEIKGKYAVDMILKRLPSYWSGCHDSYGTFSSPNDYAFIWNTKKLRECSKDNIPEVFQHVKANNLIRKPYYGRFTPAGLPGGAFFELRLIDTHLYYGSNNKLDLIKRLSEFKTISNEVYTRINKKRYGNNMPSYTILLGDYNMTAEWCDEQNIENQNIHTFQKELTTLRNKGQGFSSSYDHFTYDTNSFSNISAKVSRIDSVKKYCNSDFDKHKKEVSDHVPILIEINLIK